MSVSAFHALAHVASQLLGRWCPPFADPPLFPSRDASGMTGSDWTAYLAEVKHDLPPGAPPELVLAATRAHLDAVAAAGATYLTWADPRYPSYLRLIRDPPLALTIQGDLTLLDRPAVAVVGSRKASARAIRESFEAGRILAESGHLVVSGGAFGCDIAAHHGVLASADARACACVFAGGLETLYPINNKRIFDKIRGQGGLLVSERLWSAPSHPHDFAARNRIIAGMSPTTLVMQAAERSGALITARLALEEGREVLCLEHPQGDVRAAGSRQLTEDGAPSFDSVATLLKG